MKELKKQVYDSPSLRIVMVSKLDLLTSSLTGGFKGEDENFPTPAAQNGYVPISD